MRIRKRGSLRAFQRIQAAGRNVRIGSPQVDQLRNSQQRSVSVSRRKLRSVGNFFASKSNPHSLGFDLGTPSRRLFRHRENVGLNRSFRAECLYRSMVSCNGHSDVFLCLRQKDVIRPLLAPPFRKRSRSTLLLGYCDFLSHLRPSRQYSVPPTFFGLQSISKFFAGISFAAC